MWDIHSQEAFRASAVMSLEKGKGALGENTRPQCPQGSGLGVCASEISTLMTGMRPRAQEPGGGRSRTV